MIRLEPSFRPKVWGARTLGPWFPDSEEKIGEVWFTHAQPLPLLVKFIFTSERLSIQVHPDDAYAARHEASPGKTEMWYVLRAAPGAAIAAGFREALSRERARQAALSGEIEKLLRWFPVEPGDVFFIPAGTVHAIGAGVALCEIQQNSDVTYRLYDYGRPRQLHLDRALEVAALAPHPGPSRARADAPGESILADCEHFVTALVDSAGGECRLDLREQEILIVLEGEGALDGQAFAPGQAWLAPEKRGTVCLTSPGAARLLRTYRPR